MRVVLLIDYLSPTGGGERLAMQIALRLDRERFQRTLCVSRWSGTDRDRPEVRAALDQLRDEGVEVMLLDRESPLDVPAWRPLWKRMRAGEVDVLHAHKFGSNVWAATLARTAGVPVVITHEHNWSYEGQQLRRFLDRELIARRSDAFMAVSQENVRRMIEDEGIDPAKLMFLPNGVPSLNGTPPDGGLRSELGIAPDDPVIGTVAVLRAEKAVHVLVEAVAELLPAFPALKVLVAGDGPYRERLEALAAELGVANAFRWLGMRDDVPRVIAAFDVAVLSSIWEGSPLSVMEFMQGGKPVVASRVGGIPELIEDGVTGLLVEPGDARGLADAVARLLRDPTFRAEAGRRSRERQQAEFDLDLMVDRLGTIYERLYTEKTGSPRARRREPPTTAVQDPVGLELLGSPAAAREQWQALAERSPSIFSTWEWADAWWAVFGEGRTPLVTLARRADEAEPFAILPLYRSWDRPARIVRLIGHGPGDELGPVCAPDDRPAAMGAMSRAVTEAGGWDLFLAERLLAERDWRPSFGAQRIEREEMPVLHFEGDFESFLAARSRNFREQVRRRERKLARDHRVVFRLADSAERLQDDLSTLFRLHAARWEGMAQNAFSGPREAFHRDFAARALDRGWLRLWFLEVDDEPVAGWYGFRYGGSDSFYQAGRDPAWDGHSVGFVLMAHTVRDALDSGIHDYRLLVGNEDYKSRFANATERVDTLARAATWRGRAVLRASDAARTLPTFVRRPVGRIARR